MTEDTTGANSGRMLVQRHRLPWREVTEAIRRHSSSIMVIRMAAMVATEQQQEDTGQSMETANIKMAAMARVILAERGEVDLRKMVGEEALICPRANEGPTILPEAVWVLQEIGAGRICHEEVDHQAIPQVSLIMTNSVESGLVVEIESLGSNLLLLFPLGGRQPMDNGPMNSQGGPGFANGNYQSGNGYELANQMSQMDLNGQDPRSPPRRPPPARNGSQNYGDSRQGQPRPGPDGYAGHGDGGYGARQQPGPHGAQRSMTMPYNGSGSRGVPQRPATTTGNRPPPQRNYPQEHQAPPPLPGQYHNGYDPSYANAIDDVYDSYYDEPRASISSHNSSHNSHAHKSSVSSLPDFDAIPSHSKRDSFEQSMRQAPEQPQQAAYQTPKLGHARSMVEMREPQSAVFEMAADIPEVPAIPQTHAYQPGYNQGYNGPAGYAQPPIPRGPSAPPGAAGHPHSGFGTHRPPIVRPGTAAPTNPDGLPAHPTPIRPGQMENSLVNPSAKPPPVRNYGGGPQTGPPQQQQYQQQQYQQQQAPMQQQQQQYPPQQPLDPGMTAPRAPPPPREREPPVTPGELEHLRMTVKGNPNDQATALKLAKRLIEASDVLVPNIPDPRGKAKARERYLVDAHKILKKLVNSQNGDAMFVMADGAGRGLFGADGDSKEAFTLYQSAAKLGHAAAAYRTAVCCEIGHEEGGGTRKDPMKAIQWYKRAATLGDPPAMYKVGMILLKGLLGQPKNPREAVGWLKRAAERADAENPHALHELGLLYESASGNDVIIRDEQYALSLFQQAAEIGYKFSQFRLGCAYEYGLLGCPIDPRLSIVWYSKAAQQEEHQSELALSGWYLTGSEGVLGQSDTEAYLWARKAAVAGLAKAEYAMGYFTEVGIGVPANMEDAKRWYWRAAAQDFPKARERLEDLKRSGKEKARPRERISRSQKQQEGDCVVM